MRVPIILFLLIQPLSAVLASEVPETLDELMSEWLAIEAQKGKLESDWRERRQALDRRYELFQREKSTLEKSIDAAGNMTDDVDVRRLELLAQQEKLEREQSDVEAAINQTSRSLLAMAKRLPPPLQDQWKDKLLLLSQPEVGNSEKMERILTLLKMIEDFNQRVALHNTAIDKLDASGDKTRVMVTQIYLGVSQAWYVSDDGVYYGYGRSTPLGWQWWNGEEASKELGRNLSSQDILSLKETLENPTSASYLAMPIKL